MSILDAIDRVVVRRTEKGFVSAAVDKAGQPVEYGSNHHSTHDAALQNARQDAALYSSYGLAVKMVDEVSAPLPAGMVTRRASADMGQPRSNPENVPADEYHADWTATADLALGGDYEGAALRARKSMSDMMSKLQAINANGNTPVAYRQSDHWSFLDLHAHHEMKIDAVLNIMQAMHRRIMDLESAAADRAKGGMTYRGVFRDGTEYPEGSVVTHQGSLWHANQETKSTPGRGGGWQMCVKRGRDGKDAQ